ncbi:ATP-binding cassette domain-containing protein [Lutibacter sp. B2]|nr:ATP-binding cassette domain-containing protein [Lutibacter sp. B2]
MKNEPLLEVESLHKHFSVPKQRIWERERYVKAVDGVSFEIYRGETFGLVGESGCGKSTMGLMIGGLISPSKGKIYFERNIITGSGKNFSNKIRRNMQIVFQDPYASLNPKKKIGWTLEEPLVIYREGNKQERQKKVYEMMELVGLEESIANRYPHELSGGQRQRIAIARALMLNPQFIIGDEPVSALDVSIQAQILNLMKRLQSKLNLTYLFISHDLNVIHYMSDRVGVMYLGEIVEKAHVEKIYERAYHPYTKSLFSAIPSIEPNTNSERIILKGDAPNPVCPPTGCRFHPRCPYAMDVCSKNSPQNIEVEKGHFVRCHLYNK